MAIYERNRTLAVRVAGKLEIHEYEGDLETAQLIVGPYQERSPEDIQRDRVANLIAGNGVRRPISTSLAPTPEMGQRVVSLTMAEAYREVGL